MTLAELINYANEGIASESRNKRLSPGRAMRAIGNLMSFSAIWDEYLVDPLDDLELKRIPGDKMNYEIK